MAEQKEAAKKAEASRRPLTWQEKIDQGIKLNALEETKADADFNHTKRVREEAERQAHEERKRGISRTSDGK